MTDDELKALVASLAVSQDRTDEQMKRTDEQMKLNAIAQKATDEQIKRNDKMLTEKLDRMGITLGNIGKNQGDVAEEFFFKNLFMIS